MGPPPLVLAMIISDAIWIDPTTGKKTILGTFSAMFGQTFPLTVHQLAVYIALTDAGGVVPLKLRLVDVDEIRDPVREMTLRPDFPDPISIMELGLHMKGIVFPEPGEYRLQLLTDDGRLLIERRILVMPVQEKSNG
jgi:hypothetical protein